MKLEIQSVKFKNFLSFGSREQEIPFYTGVNVVLGKDVTTGRSNGSGKSSFLESIPFALFGQTHKEIKKEQLVNWKNRKACEVSLAFKKGEVPYRVVRSIKPDNLEIYEEGSLIEKPAHVRDYQKILEEIIGLNFNTFCSLIHSNVNSSKPILSMKKPEKRKFMDNVFGLEVYAYIQSRANDKIRNTKNKITEFEIRVSGNERSIGDAKTRIEEINSKIGNLGSHEVELRDVKIQLDEFIELYGDSAKKHKELIKKREKKWDELQEVKQLCNKAESEHKMLNRSIEDVDKKLKELEGSKVVRQQYLDYVRIYGKPSDVIEKIDQHKVEIAKYESDRLIADGELKKVDIGIAKIEQDMVNQKERIDTLKDYKECPTCGHRLEGGGFQIMLKLDGDLKILDRDKEEQVKTRNKIFNDITRLIRWIEKLKIKQVEWEERRDYLYRLKDRIKVEYDESELKRQREQYVSDIKVVEADLGTYENDLRKLDGCIVTLKDEETEEAVKAKNIEEQKKTIEFLKQQIGLEKKTRKEFRAIISTENRTIGDLKAENVEIEKKRQTFLNIVDYLSAIKEICKDENIRQFAISSIMP